MLEGNALGANIDSLPISFLDNDQKAKARHLGFGFKLVSLSSLARFSSAAVTRRMNYDRYSILRSRVRCGENGSRFRLQAAGVSLAVGGCFQDCRGDLAQ